MGTRPISGDLAETKRPREGAFYSTIRIQGPQTGLAARLAVARAEPPDAANHSAGSRAASTRAGPRERLS